MMIHGHDLVINTPISFPSCKGILVSYFRGLFPNGVHEDTEDGLMYYIDQEAKDSWDKNGRTDENASKMFHVIWKKGEVTLVHENEHLLPDEIRRNLRVNFCF